MKPRNQAPEVKVPAGQVARLAGASWAGAGRTCQIGTCGLSPIKARVCLILCHYPLSLCAANYEASVSPRARCVCLLSLSAGFSDSLQVSLQWVHSRTVVKVNQRPHAPDLI